VTVADTRPRVWLDIETYSGTDLKAAGVYRYCQDPDFEILMCAWSVDGDEVHVAVGQEEIHRDVLPLVQDSSYVKVAHNAEFERVCFSTELGMPVGTYLSPNDWDDTQARAAEHGYPQKLEHLAAWVGGEQKDTAGTRLINLFCRPSSDGVRTGPDDQPEKWAAFVEYCRQDVAALIEVDLALPDWPNRRERRAWVVDQLINDRGIALDVPMARAAVAASERNHTSQKALLKTITGLENPNSIQQLSRWLKRQGLQLPNLQAETVETTIAELDEMDPRREVLELRAELALAASNKYKAALDGVNTDHRIRGTFRFYGAHTGRWAGRGIQPHNMPREAFDNPLDEELARDDLMTTGELDALDLKRLVRSLLVGPFSVVDYSAIEARVIAWLAGERWALDAFAEGRDIYVETAARMSEVSGSTFDRRQGKIAVLALGYAGGINSLRAMGYRRQADPDERLSPEEAAKAETAEMRALVNNWRSTNAAIVQFWRDLGAAFEVGGEAGRITVTADGETRRMWLPSGRALTYHNVQVDWVTRTFLDDDGEPYEKRVRQVSFRSPKAGFFRKSTYGGKLAENATQAVARDVLSESLVRLWKAGLKPVGHVHDEILVESTELDQVVELMTTPPSWADGLPLDAEGFITPRYRKG
jgi:DNA polymerase